MSKKKEDVPKPSEPIIVLKARDPATLKILNEYLDFHKGKDKNGEPFTKFRRYRPDAAAENVFHYKNKLGTEVSFAVEQSFKVENAEKPAKEREINILGKQIAAGGVGRIKEVERAVELQNPVTDVQWVCKVVGYVNEGQLPFSEPRSGGKPPLKHTGYLEDIRAEYEATADLIGGGGFSIRPTSNRGGKAYSMIPKLNGKELFQAIANDEVKDFDKKLRIAILSLEDLKYIHGKGYVHGDIKARNIMYNKDTKKDKEIRLFDFGLSQKVTSSDTSNRKRYGKFYAKGRSGGTPGYCSPELIASERVIKGKQTVTFTEKSDLYAMGVMLNYDLRLSSMLQTTVKTDYTSNVEFYDQATIEQRGLDRKMVALMGEEGTKRLNDLLLGMTNRDPTQRCTVDEALKELYTLQEIRNKIANKAPIKPPEDKEEVKKYHSPLSKPPEKVVESTPPVITPATSSKVETGFSTMLHLWKKREQEIKERQEEAKQKGRPKNKKG